MSKKLVIVDGSREIPIGFFTSNKKYANRKFEDSLCLHCKHMVECGLDTLITVECPDYLEEEKN